MKAKMQRCYRITDSKLMVYVDRICGMAMGDLSGIERFGITKAEIDELIAINDVFKFYPLDSELKTEISEYNNAKIAMQQSLIEIIKGMSQRVALKWGDDSQEYKQLGSLYLTRMNQIELLSSARIVHSMMTEYLPQLLNYGLSQAMLDEFAALANQFEININERIKAEQTRVDKTAKRVAMGNEIYTKLKRICSTAQIAVPNKAEFYMMPMPRKKGKDISASEAESRKSDEE